MKYQEGSDEGCKKTHDSEEIGIAMFPENSFKKRVKIRVESMPDFVADHRLKSIIPVRDF